ncbi:hypothetical protein Q5425_01240 [Amycolatopsis sp. A133]|uniref:hypothetical protein n=1 Tax=Amycolatopsis sp. A133 TaxID=3064472 RepID=UPI0027E8E0CD|nr:hypothetical protein [Amycolatopsis sp. A133]MDQ7802336.1 hypothetical protein [Amycolatopsis sp. A133]
MLLVLCSLDDTDSQWFARRATRAGRACAAVTTEHLSFARRHDHRVGPAGDVRTTIELADGVVLDGSALTGVLNRVREPPALAWYRAEPAERDYASAELFAYTLSWLAGLRCPVRNKPTPQCLAGPAPDPVHAWAAAHAAGLRCAPIRLGTATPWPPGDAALAGARAAAAGPVRARQVLCLDREVLDRDVPPATAAGVRRLTGLLGAATALLGIDFLVGGDDWWFAGLTALPTLRTGGDLLVDRLLRALEA